MTDTGGQSVGESNTVLPIKRRRVLQLTAALGAGSLASEAKGATATLDTRLIDNITEFKADTEYGFNYPYLLYVPKTTTNHQRPILVEPTNMPSADDDFSVVRKYAQKLIGGGAARTISDELRVPFLVPMFPRPMSDPVDWHYEVQMLDTDTMQISSGPLKRVDLQLKKMVEHAQSQLHSIDYPVGDSILMNGYSATGNFVNRFAALHPGMVESVTAGGVNGTPILPLSSDKGYTLNYQIGIADLKDLTGAAFQKDVWTEVDQLVYMGGEDQNDTIPYDDCWSDVQRQIALEVYGQDMQEDRMPYSKQIYKQAGANADVVVYPNVGHEYTQNLINGLVDHHRKHAGGWHVSFENRPNIGANSVTIAAQVPANATTSTYEIVIHSSTNGAIQKTKPTVSPGETLETSVMLTTAPADGDELSVAIVKEGDGFSNAIQTATTLAAGQLEFVERPVAGETSVQASYKLSGDFQSEGDPTLRLETESGGAATITPLASGEQGQVLAHGDGENGVPFMAGREVALTIVDNDPEGVAPIAKTTTTVGTPDTAAAEIDVSAPPVVERGDNILSKISIRGLGGSASDASITVDVNGHSVTTESVSISKGETTTLEVPVSTSDINGDDAKISAVYGDKERSTVVILADEPANGTGSASAPYKITDQSEFAYISQDLDAAYTLEDDIDLSGISNFVIIGDMDTPFTGTLNGNDHTIKNLSIDREQDDWQGSGLFGNAKGATIKNLILDGVDIKGDTWVGGLVGNVTQSGTISDVAVSGQIVAEDKIAGGLIGGTTTSQSDSSNVQISKIKVAADIQGTTKVGGIAGQPSGDTIKQSCVTGTIHGHRVGGLVGSCYFGTTLTNSFMAGEISGTYTEDPVLARGESPTISNVYWDTVVTGHSNSTAGSATGLTTTELQGTSAATSLTGLDFDNTWTTQTAAYPTLQWLSTSKLTGQTQSVIDAVAGNDGDVQSSELLEAIKYWRNGSEVPDTGGQKMETSTFLKIVKRWRQ